MSQIELFPELVKLPEGFVYQPDFLAREEEQKLVSAIGRLPFAEFQMHGVTAKRRTVHFGYGYSLEDGKLSSAAPIPDFLLPLRQRVALLAGRQADEFAEALVTEYAPGAAIGWHRDAPPFEVIVGISLLAACTMQFRPHDQTDSGRRRPLAQVLEPRSVYIIRGESRTAWQHHIPAVRQLRYSVTFRTLRPVHRHR